jgi:RNA polymerase sigma-70 factor (ECF subfamily)
MVRLADGDRGAFHPLFEYLWPKVLRFVQKQVDADADDVAQQALCKVFERASSFDPELDALAWALGIAAYEVRTARKWRSRRREEPAAALDAMPAGHDPEQDVIFKQLTAAAAEVFGTLSEADQQTLLLVARGERPGGTTFRKRLQRSLSRVQRLWRARHGE